MADGDCWGGCIIFIIIAALIGAYSLVEPMLQNDNVETESGAIIVNYTGHLGTLDLTKYVINYRNVVSTTDKGYSYTDAGKDETYLVDASVSIYEKDFSFGSKDDETSFKNAFHNLFKTKSYDGNDAYLVFIKDDGSVFSTKKLETANFTFSKSGDRYEINIKDDIPDLHSAHAASDVTKAELRMSLHDGGKTFEMRFPMSYITNEDNDVVTK